MKVQIQGNLYLESDSMQFILREYNGKTDENGRELYKTLGYYPSIAYALKHLLKLKIMQSTATSLQELLQDVKNIEEYISSKVTV